MTDEGREGARAGSGFVSRDNDDPTAEAIFRFMDVVGIPREETLIWNLIPWWNGTRKVTGPEVREGATAVARLVDLLPALRAVMLVGRRAARAAPLLDRFALPILVSPHPSPVVRASRPALWSSIPERWALLLPHLRR